MAVVLFGIGLTFLLLGALHFRDKDRGASIAFICIGCVTFIPGAYVAFNLVQVLRGAPGFHLSQCRCNALFFGVFVLGMRRFTDFLFYYVTCLDAGTVAHWDDYRW